MRSGSVTTYGRLAPGMGRGLSLARLPMPMQACVAVLGLYPMARNFLFLAPFLLIRPTVTNNFRRLGLVALPFLKRL
jgi:hypothetical protein